MCKTQMTRILNMRMCLQVKHNSQVKCYMDNWRATVHYTEQVVWYLGILNICLLWKQTRQCDTRLSEEVFIVVFLELLIFHPHHVKSSMTSQQISYCELLAMLVKQATFRNLQKFHCSAKQPQLSTWIFIYVLLTPLNISVWIFGC